MIFFFFGNMEKRNLRKLLRLNEKQFNLKFTAEWSQSSINFSDVSLIDGNLY